MVHAIDDKVYTLEEFIQMGECGNVRHEFISGQLYAMSGASDLHNEICYNLTFLLKTYLAGKEYKVYMVGVKVKIQGEEYCTYPGVFITSHPNDLQNKYGLE